MGRLARVVSSKIDDDNHLILTVEYKKDHNIQVEYFTPSGDNSYPLEDDRVALIDIDGTGKYIAVSSLLVDQGMDEGDKIIYSRDTDGNLVAQSHYKNDGTVEHTTDSNIITNVNNDAVIQELNDDGTYNLTTDDTFTETIGGDLVEDVTGDVDVDADGNATIDATNIELNGNTKKFVTYTELNIALQAMVAAANALYLTSADNGVAGGGLTLDISASETTTIKTGG